MSLPNFIVAGFPKCGTSSLYNYLSKHPDIFLPEKKESHYLTRDILNQSIAGPGDKEQIKYRDQSIEEYKRNFLKRTTEKAIGDVSPSYVSYPECIGHIKEVLGPNVKVIILVRDPITRAYSNYLHLVSMGRETLPFEQAIEAEPQRHSEGYGDFWRYSYNSLYYDKILKFKEAFDDVMVVNFESFIHDIPGTLHEVYDFLGVEPIIPSNLDVNYNKGGVLRRNFLVNLIQSDTWLKRLLKRILPDPKLIKNMVLNVFKDKPPQISDEILRKLKEDFSEEVISMKKKFGLKTEHWKHFSDL